MWHAPVTSTLSHPASSSSSAYLSSPSPASHSSIAASSQPRSPTDAGAGRRRPEAGGSARPGSDAGVVPAKRPGWIGGCLAAEKAERRPGAATVSSGGGAGRTGRTGAGLGRDAAASRARICPWKGCAASCARLYKFCICAVEECRSLWDEAVCLCRDVSLGGHYVSCDFGSQSVYKTRERHKHTHAYTHIENYTTHEYTHPNQIATPAPAPIPYHAPTRHTKHSSTRPPVRK